MSCDVISGSVGSLIIDYRYLFWEFTQFSFDTMSVKQHGPPKSIGATEFQHPPWEIGQGK